MISGIFLTLPTKQKQRLLDLSIYKYIKSATSDHSKLSERMETYHLTATG